ncbi:uncharacterized protein LOC105199900 isoform X2 [Solenopsis invicta]|uniref:uncharacterized protein LOC105199900 isoform X2 n=1 Tax=Solenopsis invicta TaxID=13686 RepID=UPI0005962794|nr:uncharacterized protein LOC105199900 isoform X2 [Solenopsis invicta]
MYVFQTQTVDEHYKLLLEDKSVIDPDPSNVTFNDLPHWYDEKLYKKAQDIYKQNKLSIIASSTVGLILVLTVNTILKILVCTGRSNTSCSAFKRYIETVLHVNALFMSDINDADSNWYKSINTIRWHHKMGSQKSKKNGGKEISQKDMALTQYGFMGLVLIAPKSFGLCNTPEENEAFNHFWRVNGYMLGIPDSLNLCRKNVKETIELCQKIKQLYATYLSKPPPEFDRIMSNAIEAIWYVDITVDKDAFMALTYELHDLPYKKLRWYSRLNLKYHAWIFSLCHVPYIGTIIRIYNNCLASTLLWSVQHFPLLALLKFGKTNVRLNLYPKIAKLK